MAKFYTERDHQKYAQALKKAVSKDECPVKQKHVRAVIIGTFHTQGAKTFWSNALHLQAMDDQIVAWKLCHVVHKLLREGHPLCSSDSQKHCKYLNEIGKLWGHMQEGYGKMIHYYTHLLITKLKFHLHNPRFPGDLDVSSQELDSIGGHDINAHFELSVEMFDYLDKILELQEVVFSSLDMSRSNSMTCAGQCRLAPLIPCIQDASKLYDYCVKILFKLHLSLPADTLAGHRERFYKQFKQLKQFYQSSSNLQYFKDLISIPPLPENPPNFLLQSDLGKYVTQNVAILMNHNQYEGGIDEDDNSFGPNTNLIDTNEQNHSLIEVNGGNQSESIRHHHQKEFDYLQMQCTKLQDQLDAAKKKSQEQIVQFEERIAQLETDLVKKDSELVQERQVKEELINQAFTVAQNQDSEHKVKDEKFNKLKDIYYKLRDDHIQKLREKAEVDKKVSTMQKQLDDLNEASNSCEELDALRQDKTMLIMEAEILKKSCNDAWQQYEQLKNNYETIRAEQNDLKTNCTIDSERLKQLQDENERISQRLKQFLHLSKSMVRNSIEEIDNPAITALSCTSDYLRQMVKPCKEALDKQQDLEIAHRFSTFILYGKATSNTCSDITFGDRMAEACKSLGESILNLLSNKLEDSNRNECTKKLEEIAHLSEQVSVIGSTANIESLAELLENEMSEMVRTIEEAARHIEEMRKESATKDSGQKLAVNSKLLDSCTTLMDCIRILVKNARQLQYEIVRQGRGTVSDKEFYKRNHQWTDGFISAAKAVAVAAKFFMKAADTVVTSGGRLEQLAVAAHEITASTAQLVVASRVKADRNSENLSQLTKASKSVNQATGTVVATVKECSQMLDDAADDLDLSNLTLHQAKRLEMEAQVRVLELEKTLEQERFSLAALRKRHYHLAGA